MNISNVGYVSFSSCVTVDYEEQQIARKLMAYGITPTGNKVTDKAKLREIEIEKAKSSNCVLPDLLTVSKSEQEKIQQAKKEKRRENNPDIYKKQENFEGSKALGEQMYLAIKMKKKR